MLHVTIDVSSYALKGSELLIHKFVDSFKIKDSEFRTTRSRVKVIVVFQITVREGLL